MRGWRGASSPFFDKQKSTLDRKVSRVLFVSACAETVHNDIGKVKIGRNGIRTKKGQAIPRERRGTGA